jgi:hypothetical protein
VTDELVRNVEVGVVGIVLAIAAYCLGMFRVELLGVVFSLATLAAQSVIVFLEQVGASPIGSGRTDPPA